MAVAQWARRWSSDHRVVQVEGSIPGVDTSNILSAMAFILILSGLIDFSDIVMLHSGSNSCCQQNLECFETPLLSLGLFS